MTGSECGFPILVELLGSHKGRNRDRKAGGGSTRQETQLPRQSLAHSRRALGPPTALGRCPCSASLWPKLGEDFFDWLIFPL